MIIGPYTTIADGIPELIQRLQAMGANTGQIYNGSPRSLRLNTKHKWTTEEIQALRDAKLPLWIHAGHLVHLAAHPIESRNRVLADLKDAALIGSPGVVVHTGFGTDGFDKLKKELLWLDERAPKNIKIVVEVPAGEKNHIGYPYDEYAKLISELPADRFYVGLDTAHLFAGGVDLRQKDKWDDLIKNLAKWSGLTKAQFMKRVGLLHLNDSGSALGSGVDYHAPIGRGFWLGKHKDGVSKSIFPVLRWADKYHIPVILETKGDYRAEVEWIRDMEKRKFREAGLLKQKNRRDQKYGGSPNKKQILREILEDMKTYREMSGELFRARAYSRILGQLNRDETPFDETTIEYWESKPGVGEGLREKMREILATDHLAEHNEIKEKPELLAWKVFMKIPGVGASQAARWVKEGERSLEDIQERNDLTVKQKFGVEHYDDLQKRIPLKEARQWETKLKGLLGGDVSVLLMGGFRTGKKTGGDMDFIATGDDFEKLEKLVGDLIRDGKNEGWVVEGDEVWMENGWSGYVQGKNGIVRQMDIRWAPKEELPFWTLYFGSGITWNQYLRQKAKEMGFQLNQHGLYYRGTKKPVGVFKNEEEIFNALGVKYVEPGRRALENPRR